MIFLTGFLVLWSGVSTILLCDQDSWVRFLAGFDLRSSTPAGVSQSGGAGFSSY